MVAGSNPATPATIQITWTIPLTEYVTDHRDQRHAYQKANNAYQMVAITMGGTLSGPGDPCYFPGGGVGGFLLRTGSKYLYGSIDRAANGRQRTDVGAD